MQADFLMARMVAHLCNDFVDAVCNPRQLLVAESKRFALMFDEAASYHPRDTDVPYRLSNKKSRTT